MHNFTKKFILVVLSIALIVALTYGAFKLILIWVPFIMAWWISNLLSPVVEGIYKKIKIHKSLLTFIILLVFIAITLGIISLIVYLIVTQASNMLENIPEVSEVLEEGFIAVTTNFIKFTDFLPNLLTQNLDFDLAGVMQNVSLSLTTILASLVGYVAFIPNLLVGIIVMFVAAFFMTKDKYKLKEIEMQIFAHKIFRSNLAIVLKNDIFMVLLGYIKAQLILMTLTSIEVSIGLTILKIPYSILIGLGVGILDALPIFGTGTVFIPWVIILLFYQNYSLALGIFIVYLIATLGRQALEPKIISTQIGIYPLVTLLIIYTGIKIFGVTGIIIAPLIAITLLAIKKSEILKQL